MDAVFGRIPVLNAVQGKWKPKAVYLLSSSPDRRIREACEKNGVKYSYLDRAGIERIAGKGANAQGAVALVDPYRYAEYEAVLAGALKRPTPLLIVLDEIQDPVNFGSIIRSAAAFGADGIVVGKNRQVGVTPTVVKISTGGIEYVPIAQAVNLSRVLDDLKKRGFWTVGAAGGGDRYYDEVDYEGPIALVIGNEGKGISSNIVKRCDFLARIPMTKNVTSLNASVATAVFLAAVVEQRRKKAEKRAI